MLSHGDCGLRFWRESADEVKRNGQWDLDAVAQAAHYRCQHCGGEIGNGERTGMVREGIWRPYNPNAKAGRRGYHLSSLYSLVSNECTFSAIAVSWCEATGDMGKRHRIINSTFAEPWNVEKGFDERQIATEDYAAPPAINGVVKIMTIDFQLNHFWVVIRAWSPITPEKPKGESWLILATKLETLDEIKDQQEQHGIAGENVALDIAGRPNQAGQIILENGWRGLQGSDAKKFPHRLNNGLRIERIYSEVQLRDAHQGTRAQSRIVPFPFLYWAKDPVRDLVATLRVVEPTIWHVHSTAHPAYQRHLNAHVKLQRIDHKSGAPVDYWKELHNDDHLWDCECMNTVLAVRQGLAPLLGSGSAQSELFRE